MKEKFVPQRRCAVCMQRKLKEELIRISAKETGIDPDPEGNKEGRGCYVCKDEKCLRAAIKKNAAARSFRRQLSEEEREKVNAYLNLMADKYREKPEV